MKQNLLLAIFAIFFIVQTQAQSFSKNPNPTYKPPLNEWKSISDNQFKDSKSKIKKNSHREALSIDCPQNIAVCGSQVVNYSLPTVNGSNSTTAPLTLTQTTNNSIVPSNSVSCNNGVSHTANIYMRLFDLDQLNVDGSYKIEKVHFGIESASSPSGSQNVIVKVYSLSGAFVTANLTLLANDTLSIPNQSGTVIAHTLSVPVTIPANGKFVLGIETPDGRASNNLFYMGSNTSGQTAANYIVAGDCGEPNPISTAAVGYANMHAVLFAEGESGSVTPILPVLVSGLSSGSVFPVGTTTITYKATDQDDNEVTCSFNVVVNPIPEVNTVPNQVLCKDATSSAINFSSTVAGTIYNWTNSNPAIGLGASGTGNIPSFVAINAGTSPLLATITVTPKKSNLIENRVDSFKYTGAIQHFTIPAGVTSVRIKTVGAEGGTVTSNGGPYSGGKGAAMAGDFVVVPGNILDIIVGGKGNSDPSSSGGGGGTGVNLAGAALIVAGGGAGIDFQQPNYSGMNGVTAINGVEGSDFGGAAGVAGGKGGDISYGELNFSRGGNGWNTGSNGTFGENGVSAGGTRTNGTWGLGGGGGSVGYGYCNCGGGGGGYSGGGSGNINASGGGGGSINTGTNQQNIGGTNIGNGYVTIEYAKFEYCTGADSTFTITVNPTPTVNTVANQVICNDGATAAINFSGAVTGTVYNWTNSNTAIGLAASGTGNIASFTAANTTTAPITATITVTPSYTNDGTTCSGTATTFTVTVNPTPTVNTVANQVICNSGATTVINFSGAVTGTVYNWTNSNTAIGLAASGTGDIASFSATNTTTAPITATITVTPSYTNDGTTCTGADSTFTITVNPTPTVNTVANQVICNDGATTAISFSGAVTGTVYNWTNSNAAIGLAASGTGNIASFTATNNTSAAITSTITVTPSYTNDGTTCSGTATTFTVTVNPTPTVNTVANQVICNSGATTAINFSGAVTGTVYNWTNSNTAIGLAASGTGDIASFTATNTTTAPITATITVTPSYTNDGITCTGVSRTFTIKVNPTIIVNSITDKVYCRATASGAINFATTATGGTVLYNWTNSNTAIGLAASGTGNIASFTTTNTTTAPITATVTVTPSFTSDGVTCVGTARTFTITVNPTATVNAVSNEVVCNGSPVSAVNFSTTATGGTVVYNWTNNTASIGLAASGTGNIGSFNAINNGTAPVTATIRVTPTFTNAGVSCTGTVLTYTITVNPTVTVNAIANITACATNNVAAVNLGTTATGGTVVYNWTNSNPGIGLAASGTGNIPSFVAINTGLTVVSATVTVTPTFTNAGVSCVGTPITFTYTINALSTAPLTASASKTLVCGSERITLTATGGTLGTGASYKWYADACGGYLVGTGATVTNVLINKTTTYYVRIEGVCNTTSCVSTTVVAGPDMNVVLTPTPSTNTTPGTNTVLYTTISPAGNYTYEWSKNGEVVEGNTDKLRVLASEVGAYRVKVTSPEGCFAYSNTAAVAAVEETKMFITPNPNNGKFTVSVFAKQAEIGKARTIEIYDLRGAKVYSQTYKVNTSYEIVPIDIRRLPQAMYLIKMSNEKGNIISTGKFLKAN